MRGQMNTWTDGQPRGHVQLPPSFEVLYLSASLAASHPTLFFKVIHLFIWLHQVLVEVHGIFIASCRIFHCQTWAQLLCGIWDLSSPTRDETHVPCFAKWILNHWTIREVPHPMLLVLYDPATLTISQSCLPQEFAPTVTSAWNILAIPI